MNRFILAVVLLMTTATACRVKEKPDQPPSGLPWHAQWIAPPAVASAPVSSPGKPDPLANTWICFRKTLDLSSAPKSAVARIAVDSKYWLWINGKQVVFEGGLKRGPNRTDSYYDSVDLAPHLVAGKNTIAVLVWYFGKEGFSHISSGRPGLMVDAQIDGQSLHTDRSWKTRIHPAYGHTGDPKPNYRLAESNVQFDVRKDVAGWMNPNFDDASWEGAAVMGAAPVAPGTRFIPGRSRSGKITASRLHQCVATARRG